MIDIKKLAIIAVIAILFASFIFSLFGAIYERPDYCSYPLEKEFNRTQMTDTESTAYEQCQIVYEQEMNDYSLWRFGFITVLGLIAVILSIYLPFEKDSLKEWLLAGFLIGGLAAIFIGTIEYFNDANRILKPIILLIEMTLVVFVSFKKIKKSRK
jgi:hypothetical protein